MYNTIPEAYPVLRYKSIVLLIQTPCIMACIPALKPMPVYYQNTSLCIQLSGGVGCDAAEGVEIEKESAPSEQTGSKINKVMQCIL